MNKEPAEIVKWLIAEGRELLKQREALTAQYKLDLIEIDKQLRENSREVSKAIAIRNENKGDVNTELDDLESYMGTEVIICDEIFKLSKGDASAKALSIDLVVWRSDRFIIHTLSGFDNDLTLIVKFNNPKLTDIEQELIIDELCYTHKEIKTFKEYKEFVIYAATKLILAKFNDSTERANKIIEDGHKILNEIEALTAQYRRDLFETHKKLNINGK